MGRTTHYTILGVPHDATGAQIKRAYRDLAKLHHPDVSAAGDAASKKFARIAEAYKALSDPGSRRAYDRSLLEPDGPARAHPSHDPRPHYTWSNIAAHGASEAARANREEEIDELYDTFFSPPSAAAPAGVRKPPPKSRGKPAAKPVPGGKSSPAAGKKPRPARRAG